VFRKKISGATPDGPRLRKLTAPVAQADAATIPAIEARGDLAPRSS
jgi:hypothetical protein